MQLDTSQIGAADLGNAQKFRTKIICQLDELKSLSQILQIAVKSQRFEIAERSAESQPNHL